MQTGHKRVAGVIGALIALAAAASGSVAAGRSHQRALRRLSSQLAANARAAAQSAVEAKLQILEGQAMAAAQLPQIRGQIAAFDADTLKDGFRTEAWWAPFRAGFSVYGVALDGEKLEAVEGMDAAEIDAGALVRAARTRRQASGLTLAGPRRWPYAAAAAVVDVPGRQAAPVVVLAKAVDLAFAQDLSRKLGGSIVISDGRTALLSAGPDAEQAALKSAVGRESQALVEAPDGSWSSAPLQLLPGLTLWSYASIGAQADEGRPDANAARVAIWASGLLAAAIALFLGFRPEPAAPRGLTGPTGETPGTAGRTHPTLPTAAGESAQRVPALDSEGATAVQQAAPAQNVFGRYVLLDRLGEGGMAEVYTAVTYGAENFKRTFVVKRLRPEMARNPAVVSAFIDEANLASSLVHSNIVPVFDFGKLGDEYYLAMEYILGRDLGRVNRRALEKEGKALPLAQVFQVAHEVLKALDYAHNRRGPDGKPLGIVHRDVSPNNVLVSAGGEVKLFDFGIAKSEGRISQTQFGTVKGNVRFMSPEQARGEKVDSRSDLFSVGLVLYYGLSGDALYRADTAYNLLVKAAHGPGIAELANLDALPKEAQRVLSRALQTDSAARFQTAAEFAAALAPFTAGAHDALARTLERLFGEDIRAEEARFASAAAPPAGSGTQRFAAPKA